MTPWETTRPIPRDPMKLVKSAQLTASLHFTMYESHSCHQVTSAGVSIFDPLICARREELRPLYIISLPLLLTLLPQLVVAYCHWL